MRALLFSDRMEHLGGDEAERVVARTHHHDTVARLRFGEQFGGGIGESQFASFMTEQHATRLAARLDLGLMTRVAGDA